MLAHFVDQNLSEDKIILSPINVYETSYFFLKDSIHHPRNYATIPYTFDKFYVLQICLNLQDTKNGVAIEERSDAPVLIGVFDAGVPRQCPPEKVTYC